MRRRAIVCCFTFMLLQVVALPGFAEDRKFCDLSFVVLKARTGKPVKYASVVLHGVDSKGRQLHEGMQLKTNPDGKAEAGGVPYGKVRVQVIASGLQTYGEDFDLNEPAKEITIKLQEPKGQYSIYGNPQPGNSPPPQSKPPLL